MRESLCVLILACVTATARGQDTLAIADVVATKDATVLILRNDGGNEGSSSGSGFLIRIDGKTGYIVTNNHVIGSRRGVSRDRGTTHVVFRSGTKEELKVPAEIVATSPEKDLAILRVADVPNLPKPIDVQTPTELVETLPIYVFGFPFGEMLMPERGKPSVVVGKGSVSSIRRDAEGIPRAVLIDGALNPGNSGGPIVDAKGRLVGIAVATIPGAHIGIAIAPPELLSLLEGWVEGLNLTMGERREKDVELTANVVLVDPLDRIQSLRLLHRLGGSVPAKGRKDKEWKPLPGSTTTTLKKNGQKATGTIAFPAPSSGSLDVVYQVVTTDKLGHATYGKPGRLAVSADKQNGDQLAASGEVFNPDGDCKIQVENGVVTFEIPGTYHDLNSEFGKFNAPRILQDVDGDFVAQVKVCGEFQPAEPTTRDSAVPSNGAGIVVWVDADTFVRFERFGILRNDRRGVFLLFESRELGQVQAKNSGRIDMGDVYMKLERKGKQLSGSFSTDGEHWTQAKPMELDWPARVKVGLNAVSSSFDPFIVRFEEFSIRKPPGK